MLKSLKEKKENGATQLVARGNEEAEVMGKRKSELGVHPTASAVSVNPYAVIAKYCLMYCSAPSTIRIICCQNHAH